MLFRGHVKKYIYNRSCAYEKKNCRVLINCTWRWDISPRKWPPFAVWFWFAGCGIRFHLIAFMFLPSFVHAFTKHLLSTNYSQAQGEVLAERNRRGTSRGDEVLISALELSFVSETDVETCKTQASLYDRSQVNPSAKSLVTLIITNTKLYCPRVCYCAINSCLSTTKIETASQVL